MYSEILGMKIGNISFEDYPLFLAPMEDVTDPAFRLTCKRFGADMVYTEFVSSDALVAKDKTLTINLNHIMKFNRKKFNAHIVNTNIDVFTNWDYIQAAVNLL